MERNDLTSGMDVAALEGRLVAGLEPGLGGIGMFNLGDGIGSTKGCRTLRTGERSGVKCLLTLSTNGLTLRSTGDVIGLYGKGDLWIRVGERIGFRVGGFGWISSGEGIGSRG